MKKIVLLMVFIITFSFSNTFTKIINNVSLPDINRAIKDMKNLQKSYSKKDFKKLIYSWKKVEALYFAGLIDENYVDVPMYIDIFHEGNEDIKKQLDRAILSKDDANISLFKNSNKSINAIEYILYRDKKLSKREKELLDVMFKAILGHLNDIKIVYENYLKGKEIDEKKGNSIIINTLIDSTYKLKDWRVGDAAGFSRKYKGKPDNKRGEYYLSKQSFNAILAILDAHEEIIGNKTYYNFSNMAMDNGAKKEILFVREAMEKSKKELLKLKNDDFSKAKNLYKALVTFHNAYYLSLIEQLSITAKILEADGD